MEDMIEKIADLIKKAGKFTLTKSEPKEHNHELVLQLLEGLEGAEKKLPVSLLKKVWAYRYQKYRLFLELHVMPLAIDVDRSRLHGLSKKNASINELGQHTNVAHTRTRYTNDVEEEQEKKANIIFIPPLSEFPYQIGLQVKEFNSKKGYQNFAKFINIDKNAVNVSFHEKHKYVLKKDVNKDEIAAMIETRLEAINEELNYGNEGKQRFEIRNKEREQSTLKHILKRIDKLKFSASNYEKWYYYLTMNYRYIDYEIDYGAIKKGQEQISKKRKGNFVCIDKTMINKVLPRADKKVHEYIESCECFLSMPTMNFYYEK